MLKHVLIYDHDYFFLFTVEALQYLSTKARKISKGPDIKKNTWPYSTADTYNTTFKMHSIFQGHGKHVKLKWSLTKRNKHSNAYTPNFCFADNPSFTLHFSVFLWR